MNEYSLKDIITQAIISIDFPAQYIATINDPKLANVSIKDFYDAFCKKIGIEKKEGSNILFQPASILGFLYTSFLLPQQNFYDHIPTINLDENDWGIKIIKGSDFSMKTICTRLRNSLAHNHFFISKNMIFTFWDAEPKIKSIDKAEVIYEFTFDGIMFKFLRKWSEFCLSRL